MAAGPRARPRSAGVACGGPGAAGREQRLAAAAALGLFVTMLLPWYTKTETWSWQRAQGLADHVSAFGAFSFVEAAVLLVSAGVLVMLFTRAERRAFHLPGGDGMIIMLAGAWAAMLIFYRMLDKPGLHGNDVISATEGITWGIFLALLVAIASGLRRRARARGRASRAAAPVRARRARDAAGARPRRGRPRRPGRDRSAPPAPAGAAGTRPGSRPSGTPMAPERPRGGLRPRASSPRRGGSAHGHPRGRRAAVLRRPIGDEPFGTSRRRAAR